MSQLEPRDSHNKPSGKIATITFLIIVAFILGSVIASAVTFFLLKNSDILSKTSPAPPTPSPTAPPAESSPPSPAPSPTPPPTPSAVQPSPTPIAVSTPQPTNSPQLPVSSNSTQPTVTPTPIASPNPTPQPTVSPSVDPGNSLSQALDIGNLKGTRTYNDFVGSVDLEDYYRFKLDTTSNFQLALTCLSKYTHVELILDRNGNGQVDNGEVLNSDSGSSSASIRTPLGAGIYAIRIFPNDRNSNTTYTLQVSGTEVPATSSDPGNTLNQALDMGNFSGERTYNDFVGSVDPNDYYRFKLDRTSNVQVSISSLSKYTHVELILDRNENGQIDNGEVLNSDSGSSSASIRTPLGAGIYAIRVTPNDNNSNTTYTLQVSVTPVGAN
jgi:hypothetical protein